MGKGGIDPGTAQIGVADDLEVLHPRVFFEGIQVIELEHVGASRWHAEHLGGLPLLLLGKGIYRGRRRSRDAQDHGQAECLNADHASPPTRYLP